MTTEIVTTSNRDSPGCRQLRDRWTPRLRVAAIAWSWALLAAWAYYCVDLQRWLIVTDVASQGPRGERSTGLIGIVYLIPAVISILGLILAKWFVVFLALATLLALCSRPLLLILAIIFETVVTGLGTVLLIRFGSLWLPVWVVLFILQATFAGYLVLVMTERRELRESLAASLSGGNAVTSTQPN